MKNKLLTFCVYKKHDTCIKDVLWCCFAAEVRDKFNTSESAECLNISSAVKTLSLSIVKGKYNNKLATRPPE